MEPFDIDDASFFPCTCGYQVSFLCYFYTLIFWVKSDMIAEIG